MGYMNARGFADAAANGEVTLTEALAYHLTTNHYPPVPVAMVPACIEAIGAVLDDDPDHRVYLPEGVTYRTAPHAPASAIVEAHHLDAFIDAEEDED